MRMFADFVFQDQTSDKKPDPISNILTHYFRDRMIPFRIDGDGTFYAKRGQEWLRVECEPGPVIKNHGRRYTIYMDRKGE